jgi:4-aminobutyrate--pyruvate transaminase
MYEAMLDESRKIGTFGHGYTYSGHPVGCAVALKTLEIYQRDRIIETVRDSLIPRFWKHLDALRGHDLVGEVRGNGFVAGIELVADKTTKAAFPAKVAIGAKAVALAQSEGVILRNLGDTLAVCPPLVTTLDDLDDLFARIGRAIDKVEAMARREGWRA